MAVIITSFSLANKSGYYVRIVYAVERKCSLYLEKFDAVREYTCTKRRDQNQISGYVSIRKFSNIIV